MSKSNYRRDACRLCGSRNLELALRLTPTPLADSYVDAAAHRDPQPTYPLDLDLCSDCGFAQLRDVIQGEAIYIDYIYETKSSLGLVEHFQRYANAVVEQLRPAKDSLVIDIGSNDGTLLSFFKKHGLRVLGIDPAREIARMASESGIETLPDFFTPDFGRKIRNERGPATIITANNLFANVDNLSEMTETIRDLLAPDGVFVFESFYTADLIQNMVFDFIYHEHLSYFSVKPLITFFRRHGMELINAERVPTKGGSLRYTVQLAGGPRKVSSSIEELTAHEASIGLHRRESFEAFAARIDAARASLDQLLQELRAKGKKIDGYGASATTTTLEYHFGLGDKMGCIYDDYPAKQGLFSPGHHLPVLPSQAIYERKPEYVIILAWRYFEAIVEKHREFLQQGGYFIVPLPELNVL
jgi:SAM-dependent methyltransferase